MAAFVGAQMPADLHGLGVVCGEAREPLVIGRSARVGEVRLVGNLVLAVDFHPAAAGERRPVRKAEFWPEPAKRQD